jgi:hypothetical protein
MENPFIGRQGPCRTRQTIQKVRQTDACQNKPCLKEKEKPPMFQNSREDLMTAVENSGGLTVHEKNGHVRKLGGRCLVLRFISHQNPPASRRQ